MVASHFFLPSELWLEALRYLSNTDLKALRLSMDPNLLPLASSLLFATAYIAARKGVLDTFTNVTTHPIFRAYVTEIVFDSSWIHPATFAGYSDYYSKRALVGLFKQQEDIQEQELRIRLENAFECLSKVKKVSYADLSRISCLPGDRREPRWGYHYSDGPLIRRLESDNRPGKISLCCLMRTNGDRCSGHEDEFRYRRMFGGLVLLLQVLSDYASTTLQQLSLGSRVHSCTDGGIPHWFLLSTSNINTLYCFPNVFYSLRKLELSVSIFYGLEVPSSVLMSAQLHPEHFKGDDLANILGLAKNLEEIKLIGEPEGVKMCIAKTLVTHYWARLRVFYLKGFEAGASELEDFLKRHTLSLKRLTLDDFNLTSGSWRGFGASVPVIAPALELILGLVLTPRGPFKIENVLELTSYDPNYLDVSGPSQAWYDKAKRYDDAESQAEDEDEYEDEALSDLERLNYSSDDSSSETDEPRRKPDIDLYENLDVELRAKVDLLQSRFPGCPAQECLRALDIDETINTAQKILIQRFHYTEIGDLDPETRASVERLMDEMPVDVDVLECIRALRSSGGHYGRARKDLQYEYGHRQKTSTVD